MISFKGSLHFCLTTSLRVSPQLSYRQSDDIKIRSSDTEPSTLYIFTFLPYLRVLTAFFSFYWLFVWTAAIPFSFYTFFNTIWTSFSQFFSFALLIIVSLSMLFSIYKNENKSLFDWLWLNETSNCNRAVKFYPFYFSSWFLANGKKTSAIGLKNSAWSDRMCKMLYAIFNYYAVSFSRL